MKNALPVLIFIAVFFMCGGLNAGEISIYRDKNGVINLTDKPAPPDARVQEIIRFKKNTDDFKQPQLNEQSGREFQKRQEARKIRELNANAEKTRKEAEKESALAREKIKKAEAYIERYNQKKRSLRRRYRKKARQITQEAREAQTRANAAILRANKAAKSARDAAGISDNPN